MTSGCYFCFCPCPRGSSPSLSAEEEEALNASAPGPSSPQYSLLIPHTAVGIARITSVAAPCLYFQFAILLRMLLYPFPLPRAFFPSAKFVPSHHPSLPTLLALAPDLAQDELSPRCKAGNDEVIKYLDLINANT